MSARERPAAARLAELRRELRGLADVLEPQQAEEPILAPVARAAVFEWLTELRCAEELASVGLTPRASAVLFGPPGCGKTTLAHHLAARLGVPMIVVGQEHLMRSFLGQSEQQLERLFEVLGRVECAPVVFIDEIEAIGMRRDRFVGGGADNARASIITVLLRRIEQFRGMLIGATNRPQDLDPALWRRFGMQISVDLPGEDERFAILRRYLHPFTLPDESLDVLVGMTGGASPALLRGVMEGVKRALVIGARTGRGDTTAEGVIGRIVAGLRPPPELPPPPLWDGALADLALITWPPVRGDA